MATTEAPGPVFTAGRIGTTIQGTQPGIDARLTICWAANPAERDRIVRAFLEGLERQHRVVVARWNQTVDTDGESCCATAILSRACEELVPEMGRARSQ